MEKEKKMTIDNSRVVAAVQALKAEPNQENSRKLTLALSQPETHLLLPLGPGGKGIMMLNTSDGKKFLPAFTSGSEALKNSSVTAQTRIAAVDINRYGELLKADETIIGVVLDPQGLNFLIPREAVLRLSAYKEAHDKLPKGPVKVLCPKDDYSNDMTKALGKELYKIPEVNACYLRIAERGEGDAVQRNWLFVLDYSGEDFASVTKVIFETCKRFLPKDARIEITKRSSDLGQKVTEQGEPFFRRQMLWV